MAEPLKAVLGQKCKHAGDACRVEDSLVWYTILPRDTQNSPEVAQVKGVEPVFLAGMGSPRLAAIEQSTEHTGLVHLYLSVEGQHGFVRDPHYQVGHAR